MSHSNTDGFNGNTDVTIAVLIIHPGQTGTADGRTTLRLKADFPLADVVAAGGRELVELALGGLFAEAARRWRHEHDQWHNMWGALLQEAAVDDMDQ